MHLAEAMNTYNIALYTIRDKGFNIELELADEKGEIIWWIAKKGDVSVSANTPLSLLALTEIAERYGESWNKVNTADLYQMILDQYD